MSFLIDTSVISAFGKPRRDPVIDAWVDSQDPDTLFLSVAVVAELRQGAAKTPITRAGFDLQAWLDDGLLPAFKGRILPIDAAMAPLWGSYMQALRAIGVRDVAMDAAIAATAAVHGLTVVTRNVRHFAPLGVPTFDPYEGQPTADLDA